MPCSAGYLKADSLYTPPFGLHPNFQTPGIAGLPNDPRLHFPRTPPSSSTASLTPALKPRTKPGSVIGDGQMMFALFGICKGRRPELAFDSLCGLSAAHCLCGCPRPGVSFGRIKEHFDPPRNPWIGHQHPCRHSARLSLYKV